MYSTKGFTLVELIVSIVVIGVLAAIGITTYSGIQRKAYNSAVVQSVNDWKKILTISYARNGSIDIQGSTHITQYICLGQDEDYARSGDFSEGACESGDDQYRSMTNFRLTEELNKMEVLHTPATSVIEYGEFNRMYRGVMYRSYNNGQLVYYLHGASTDCGIGGAERSPYESTDTVMCTVDLGLPSEPIVGFNWGGTS